MLGESNTVENGQRKRKAHVHEKLNNSMQYREGERRDRYTHRDRDAEEGAWHAHAMQDDACACKGVKRQE